MLLVANAALEMAWVKVVEALHHGHPLEEYVGPSGLRVGWPFPIIKFLWGHLGGSVGETSDY